MRTTVLCVAALWGFLVAGVRSQVEGPEHRPDFNRASETIRAQLKQAIEELNILREKSSEELIVLTRKLNTLETELISAKKDYQDRSRTLEKEALRLVDLETTVKSRVEEEKYFSSLFMEFVRGCESNLHIAELGGALGSLDSLKTIIEGPESKEKIKAQTDFIENALERLESALGGRRLAGRAISRDGSAVEGDFAIFGPWAVFYGSDSRTLGQAAARLGSIEPAVVPFPDQAHDTAVKDLFAKNEGFLPLDPTLGNASKVYSNQDTFFGHVSKGGPVMIPIGILAIIALLIGLLKLVHLTVMEKSSRKKLDALVAAVNSNQLDQAKTLSERIPGPIGRMLEAGTKFIGESKETIEEAMYEIVVKTRLSAQRFLPFIAIAAAAAPLLGLLGTVTGIINTFKMITIFGSGDVRALSGGISEALITTKFGLIVAVPALLVHAYLSRKAKGIISGMEVTAVNFMNRVSGKIGNSISVTRKHSPAQVSFDRDALKNQVNQILKEVLKPLSRSEVDVYTDQPIDKAI